MSSDLQADSAEAQAVSGNGLWRLTAEPATHTLVLQDALGMPVRRYVWPEPSHGTGQTTLVTPVQIRDHPVRQGFVIVFGGCQELWEISYNPAAEDIFDGLVHDYRLHEGLPRPGFLGVRRTRLAQPLDDFWIDSASPHVLGRVRWAQGELHVINLDIRRLRTSLPLPAQARLSQAQRVADATRQVLWIPVASGETGICLSTQTWQIVPCSGDEQK